MKKLIDFKDIDRARKLLGLGETTSMQEIKEKYRKLSLKCHPDSIIIVHKKKCMKRK